MQRRDFISSASALPFLSVADIVQSRTRIVPGALPKGATLGLVAPASAVSRSAFESALENVSTLGFQVKYSDNLRVRRGFLSGTDQQRVKDLHDMYLDSEVNGIMCIRGGYGSARLLPQLDYDLIRSNAKPLIGYSDITALHQAIYQRSGVVGYHGPVGASEYNDFTLDYFHDVVMKGKNSKIRSEEAKVIFEGSAEGLLAGGNLSLLASLVGTPYAMDYAGHILFIEEVGESTYRIDRMLTQLKQSGALKGVAGIALGYFTNCDQEPGDPGYEISIGLEEVFREQFAELNVPVVMGLPFGHESHNVTLPIGIKAELSSKKKGIKLLERPVA